MANKYTDKEWEELKNIIFTNYPIYEDESLKNLFWDISDHINSPVSKDVNTFLEHLENQLLNHSNKMLRGVASNIYRYLSCDFKDVALGINVECVKNIVSWRLEHGR